MGFFDTGWRELYSSFLPPGPQRRSPGKGDESRPFVLLRVNYPGRCLIVNGPASAVWEGSGLVDKARQQRLAYFPQTHGCSGQQSLARLMQSSPTSKVYGPQP